MNTFAIITTLNEADSITLLVRRLTDQGLRVCVVDDASDDDTAYLARRAGAYVIYHHVRRGIGPSLAEGWRWALGQGATAVVQLDAGGSHDAAAACVLLGRLADADMAIGSRFRPGAAYHGSLRRRMLSQVAALACNLRYFHGLDGFTDWTSGYRAFSASALRKLSRLDYTATMHGWQIEVLQAALWLKLHVVEAPITYYGGRSSFNRRAAREAFNVWNSRRFASRS